METKNFLAMLFDFEFNEFVTTRILRVVFALGIVASGVAAFGFLLTGLAARSGVAGVGALVGAPLIFLVGVIGSRIYCELIIVVFRVAENTARLVQQGEPHSASASAGPSSETPGPEPSPRPSA